MKKRACMIIYVLTIWVFIQPMKVDGNPINTDANGNYETSIISECSSTLDRHDLVALEGFNTKYSDLTIGIEYNESEMQESGVCKITLDGTIETDIGTVTFDNVVIEVSLNAGDCVDFAIRLLNSFKEDKPSE